MAIVDAPPPQAYGLTPGVDARYPLDFDHVAAVQAHAERQANTAALAAAGDQPDDQERIDQERLARLCDPLNDHPAAAAVCGKD